MKFAAVLLLAGCAGSTHEPDAPLDPPPPPLIARQEPATAAPAGTVAPQAIRGSSSDAPEISRSAGADGGVLIFWPRVSPRTVADATRDIAKGLQGRLREMVARTFPGKAIDVRPEPERVCPRAGCAAMTIGVLLTRNQNGCAALALVSAPGTAPAKIVPWGGGVRLRAEEVPFREPPEPQVTVTDYVGCDGFLQHEDLQLQEGQVIAAIRAAAP